MDGSPSKTIIFLYVTCQNSVDGEIVYVVTLNK